MGEKTRSEKYTYSDGTDGDGSLTQLKTGSGHKINYTYDALKHLKNASVVNSSNVELFKTACSYRTVSGNQSSAQVEFRNIRTTGGDLIVGYKYSYDALGNITQISQSEGNYNPLVKYTYDSQNQLIKEVHYDGSGSTAAHITHTYTYTYDTAGNIQSETKTVGSTTTTKSYTYSSGDWKDLLIEVGGTAISYDSNGNPSNWYNGSKTYSKMKWANGRQLTSVTIGSKTADYAYDANGIRTQKTVGDVTHTYYTLNGKLMRETFPDGDVTIIMDFIYDESGKPFAVCYSKNGGTSFTTYFYGTNAQGDVEKIFRVLQNAETGKYEEKLYGYYTYDAWGNVTAHTTSGNTPGSATLVYRNPIRYRGYVYDNETGWYYLQSRYYDPANHRFINADTYASTNPTNAIAYNLFAYCNNNPVMRLDSSGKISFAFSLGFTFNLFGFGGSISISLVSTDNDLGMQYSYYLSDDKDTSTQTIGFDVGPCVGVQITEKESIKELEGLMRATGGDAVFGCDILTDTNGKYVGWAIGSSLISNNMHSTISQTKTIWKVKRWDWIDAVFDLLGVKLQ